MRIIDCILYRDEPITLKRIEYLSEYIDDFFIFEPNFTLNGLRKKQLTAHRLYDLFPDLKDKIHIIPLVQLTIPQITAEAIPVVSDADITSNLSEIMKEIHQYLVDHIDPKDICFISLAEEIPMHSLIQFIRLNAKKLSYPVHALGDYFTGSSIHHNAETYRFHTQNFWIDYDTLVQQPDLLAIRDQSEKYILMQSTQGIGMINPSVKFNHDKKQHKNINLFKPLVIKFNDFFDVKDFYKKLISSCQIVEQKQGVYPYFKNNSLAKEVFLEYINADYQTFKKNMIYLSHHLQVFHNTRHQYLIDHIPQEFYNFGVDVAEAKCCMPNETILQEYYHEIYPIV